MKIKILYSHLNVSGTDNKARPHWFDFERCFKNLVSTIDVKGIDVELHVIYDITRGKVKYNWIDNIDEYFLIHEIQGGSMEAAAVEMYKIAKELSKDMDDNDLFYFCENDYLHTSDWVSKLKELFEMYGLDGGYVSLYDHNDKYFLPQYENLSSKIFVTENHHWRTTPSTCGTYAVNRKTFLEDFDVLTSVMGDHNKWLHLAETKHRFVLSALPGLSTHCMEGLMSPTIKWEEL